MSTKKSLIVSMALVLALVCTGIIAASAHTAPPAKTKAHVHTTGGINFDPLGLLNLAQRLNPRIYVNGAPLNHLIPTAVDRLRSADISILNPLGSLLNPEQPKLKRFIVPTPIKRRP